MKKYIVHKLLRVTQGSLAILFIVILHKYLLKSTSSILIIPVSIMCLGAALLVLYILKDEIVQLILGFKAIEDIIDIEKEYMWYSWENIDTEGIKETGTVKIKYFLYKDEKIIVSVEDL